LCSVIYIILSYNTIKVKEVLKFEYRICTSFNWTSKFAEEMKTCFFNSGFKFKNFKGLDNRNAKEKSELISEAEVVILAGGHVPTQNIFFQQINLKNMSPVRIF
ncbi:MAG: hypothetical protein L0J26_12525, partial [Lactococcus lactis]|nr:hypothetical protein [Lactococcus lactis]MDN6424066.1 hypothetical protein [Tetragenococcus koreensis]